MTTENYIAIYVVVFIYLGIEYNDTYICVIYIFRLLDHISTLGLQGEMGDLFHRWQLSRQIRVHNDKNGEIDGLIVSS